MATYVTLSAMYIHVEKMFISHIPSLPCLPYLPWVFLCQYSVYCLKYIKRMLQHSQLSFKSNNCDYKCSDLELVSRLCFDPTVKLPDDFPSLIHHLLYSEPSCVYGDDVKTSPFLVESTGARNIEYSLGYFAPDCYSSLYMFFMFVL